MVNDELGVLVNQANTHMQLRKGLGALVLVEAFVEVQLRETCVCMCVEGGEGNMVCVSAVR